jgi:hypothetical protein
VICVCGRTEGATEDGILFGGMYSGGGSGCWERRSRVPGDEVQAGDICGMTGISDIGVSAGEIAPSQWDGGEGMGCECWCQQSDSEAVQQEDTDNCVGGSGRQQHFPAQPYI